MEAWRIREGYVLCDAAGPAGGAESGADGGGAGRGAAGSAGGGERAGDGGVSRRMPFGLQWTGVQVDTLGALPLVTMECAIRVCDRWERGQWRHGSRAAAGGDGCGAGGGARTAEPRHGGEDELRGCWRRAWRRWRWRRISSGAMRCLARWRWQGERMERTATVEVFAYQEAGEL